MKAQIVCEYGRQNWNRVSWVDQSLSSWVCRMLADQRVGPPLSMLISQYEFWCRRRDLNPHGLRHTPLKRACLPFHHFGTMPCLTSLSTAPRPANGLTVTPLSTYRGDMPSPHE